MNDETEEYPEPYSKEDIEKMIRNKYFDKDGNAIAEYWENTMKVKGITDFIMPKITGFEVYFIKDAQTNDEDWFLVEFEPIGCYLGCRYSNKHQNDSSLGGSWPHPDYAFSGLPSYAKLLGIPYEKLYCRSKFLFALIDDIHYMDHENEEKVGPLMIEVSVAYGTEYIQPGVTYDAFFYRYGVGWIDKERAYLRTYNPEKNGTEKLYIYRPFYGEYDPFEDYEEELRQFVNEQ